MKIINLVPILVCVLLSCALNANEQPPIVKPSHTDELANIMQYRIDHNQNALLPRYQKETRNALIGLVTFGLIAGSAVLSNNMYARGLGALIAFYFLTPQLLKLAICAHRYRTIQKRIVHLQQTIVPQIPHLDRVSQQQYSQELRRLLEHADQY